jgi:hypothetical protein
MTTDTTPTALVVVESMFGNTEEVGRAVAQGLAEAGVRTEVLDVRTAPIDVPTVDLLVVGAPTHAFSMSRPSTRAGAVDQGAPPARAVIGLREWLGRAMPSSGRTPQRVAVFDTRATKVRRLPAAAGPKAVRLARRRGFSPVGHAEAFLVRDVKGPLEEGENERARAWGQELAAAWTRPRAADRG